MKYLLYFFCLALPTIVNAANVTSCGVLGTANTTYVLQNDVSSTGSCFSITANNVVLDLNGHTIKYDDYTPTDINGSFENALSNTWDISEAANATRNAGSIVQPVSMFEGGSYALRVATPTADQTITSLIPITLDANTTYSIGAMIHSRVSSAITVSVGVQGVATAANSGRMTERGFEFIKNTFTTGVSPASAVIEIKVTGAGSAPAGYVYFDNIILSKQKVHGVSIGVASWESAEAPGLPAYGAASGATVKNGSIVQGLGMGVFSHAIYTGENSHASHIIQNNTLTVSGPNTSAYYGKNASNVQFINNVINHNTRMITSRDAFDGAGVKIYYSAYGSTFSGNITNTGCQTAYYLAHVNGTASNDVYNNNITLQTLVSNDFAIVAGGALIHNNTINCGSGINMCRGVGAGGTGTKTYNNTITVQTLPINQEYNGCTLGGAYGIQAEVSINTEIYSNNVTAIAGACEAHAFRSSPGFEGGGSSNISVHDNIFISLKNGTAHASSLKYATTPDSVLSFYNNTMITNDLWIYVDYGTTSSFSCNRWETSGMLTSPFQPFLIYDWNDLMQGILTFHNNSYGVGDQARFESEYIRDAGIIDTDSVITLTNGAPLCGSDTTAPTTTPTPSAGTYTNAQTVTLSCADNVGCTSTQYCTGAGCTPSTSYTAPLSIATTTTLRYRSGDAAGNMETIKESIYTISVPASASIKLGSGFINVGGGWVK